MQIIRRESSAGLGYYCKQSETAHLESSLRAHTCLPRTACVPSIDFLRQQDVLSYSSKTEMVISCICVTFCHCPVSLGDYSDSSSVYSFLAENVKVKHLTHLVSKPWNRWRVAELFRTLCHLSIIIIQEYKNKQEFNNKTHEMFLFPSIQWCNLLVLKSRSCNESHLALHSHDLVPRP